MRKVTEQELNRMALKGGAKVKRNPVSRVPTESEIAASNTKPTPTPPAAPPDSSIPFASMQASMGASNQMLAEVVENNSRVISEFRQDMQGKKPLAGVAYRHTVRRGRDKLIEYVDSIPMEMRAK